MSHRLVRSEHVHDEVHGSGRIGRFNAGLAVRITQAVGTMWAAYLFIAIALVSFPAALQALVAGDTLTGITWLSQSFLQLVLLPIIIVGQNVISRVQDARAETDHETLTTLHEINVKQSELLDVLHKLGAAIHQEASTAARSIDAVGAEIVKGRELAAALNAYEESHARYEDSSINGHPHRERVACQCALCTQGRKAITIYG